MCDRRMDSSETTWEPSANFQAALKGLRVFLRSALAKKPMLQWRQLSQEFSFDVECLCLASSWITVNDLGVATIFNKLPQLQYLDTEGTFVQLLPQYLCSLLLDGSGRDAAAALRDRPDRLQRAYNLSAIFGAVCTCVLYPAAGGPGTAEVLQRILMAMNLPRLGLVLCKITQMLNRASQTGTGCHRWTGYCAGVAAQHWLEPSSLTCAWGWTAPPGQPQQHHGSKSWRR